MKKQYMIFFMTALTFLGQNIFAQNRGEEKMIREHSTAGAVNITLTVDNIVITAMLYDNPTTKDLLAKLPLTVSLSRFNGQDYCGGNLTLRYEAKDIQDGYHDGELAYWIPGKNFVMFFDNEELSLGEAHQLVIIGKVTVDLEVVKLLPNSIRLTISRIQ
jgi:hypothetical protein